MTAAASGSSTAESHNCHYTVTAPTTCEGVVGWAPQLGLHWQSQTCRAVSRQSPHSKHAQRHIFRLVALY